ncbi:MAG TPA: efflux RND transporter permease subunit [Bdellovibrionota bacterium]|nr:efflux RND transporter permease subunit [Bdellovibrionota bacterium]
MKSLYSSPLRVYLMLGAAALAGILAGTGLPVSLFPNSSKPQITVSFSYGFSTADEFLNEYGRGIEETLRAISTDGVEVEKVEASYNRAEVRYGVEFRWGVQARAALREVQVAMNSVASRMPVEIRDSMGVWNWNENGGFLAISFYSPTRSLDELYDILDPALMPQVKKVRDAEAPELWNPTKKEIRVELDPAKLAALQLFPKDVDGAIRASLAAYTGGSVTIGTKQLQIEMPRQAQALAELTGTLIQTPAGPLVHLGDIAKIDLAPRVSDNRSFKTDGAASLILFSTPRPGGNVKRMSEEIVAAVHEKMPSLPKDIQYKVLVDPSEFIRSAINNVFHEVALGAMLAVVVLFFFIGSFRNTVTAAIEIPMSMVLAFILMKLSGMNLNLISLGGLALSAGMNVDASVVVMENIFRHFEEAKGPFDFKRRLEIVCQAVSEVRFAVIASTLASLVVFLPLAFTSDLSYAILGDLAKTVVFSHGLSAFVALILVPTVRLHLMSRAKSEVVVHSPIEKWIKRLENAYARALGRFIASARLKAATYAGLILVLVALVTTILPRLPREIVGRPDTDWMMLGINTNGNTLSRQMESLAEEMEAKLLALFGPRVQYTFTQIQGPNSSWIMARLRDKKEMNAVWKEMEATFANTPVVNFWVAPWNPSELPIPDPPNMRVVIRGGTLEERAEAARSLEQVLQEKQVFPRLSVKPDPGRYEAITLRPKLELWPALRGQGARFLPSDLADLARVATIGRRVMEMPVGGRTTEIRLAYPVNAVTTEGEIASLPVGVGSKLVPLKALAAVSVEPVAPTLFREDGRDLFLVTGKESDGHEQATGASKSESKAKKLQEASRLIEAWKTGADAPKSPTMTVSMEDAEKDLNEALRQLALAVALSILLIFITLVFQFGDVVNSLLVLVAVPLGFIGVLVSLWAFGSTLSLNSALGVILLNGLAVANSIILVDFMKRLVDSGMAPEQAAVQAARKRLRPILITSLCTILGMLPIALGMGDGGRILQPLGIAVSGGLWVSMGLTLFVVPALQTSYLSARRRRSTAGELQPVELPSSGMMPGLAFEAASAVSENRRAPSA